MIHLTNVTNVIHIVLSTGKKVPFRQTTAAKSGNTVYGILNAKGTGLVGHFGRNVATDVVGKTLPSWVEIDGQRVELKTGKSLSEHDKVSCHVPVTVNGDAKVLDLRINAIDGGYNVWGSIHALGGTNTGTRAKSYASAL